MSDNPPLAPRFEAIPAELTARDQWVCWRLEARDGDPKPTKVPYDPATGARAKADDPKTWRPFAIVRTAYEKSQGGPRPYSGVGFELAAGDPFFGGDLDKCIDPETGEVAGWAAEIIAEAATYTERSPSGTGLRFFGLGCLPAGGRKKGPVELYEWGRFLTITGETFGAASSINDCAAILPALHARLFPEKTAAVHTPRPSVPVTLSDRDLIDKAMQAANGGRFSALWNGDTSAYGGDESSADLALCGMLAFWTQGDERSIDSLFRQSGLMRPKWDEQRGDQTYGQRTTGTALAGKSEFYTPPGVRTAKAATEKYQPAAPKPKASPAAAEETDKKPTPGEPFKLTQLGNAERLIARHGRDLRYSPAFGWLVWNNGHWEQDESGEVMRHMKETVRQLYAEAALLNQKAAALPISGDITASDPNRDQASTLADMAQAIMAWAKRSESYDQLSGAIKLAQSEPGVYIATEDLDAKPWLFNCANGTLDLQTGVLQPHRREDLLTKRSPVAYDPQAACPRWLAFLERILPDADVRSYLRRAVGYSLTGRVSEQCLFFLYGSGSNGKSTLLKTLLLLLHSYGLQANGDLLTARSGDGNIPNDVARLKGSRLVATIETEEGKRMAEQMMKQLTGGDHITARFLRKEFFTFAPSFKIFLAANHKPVVRNNDHALWRRIKLLPFTETIGEEEKDPRLDEKLAEELPGILAWAVDGCLEWQRDGIQVPKAVEASTKEYRADSDFIGQFLADCCIEHPTATVKASNLFKVYQQWCGETEERPLVQRNFGMRITDRGFDRYANNGTWYIGLGLKAQAITEVTEGSIQKSGISCLVDPSRQDKPEIASVPSVGSAENDGQEVLL